LSVLGQPAAHAGSCWYVRPVLASLTEAVEVGDGVAAGVVAAADEADAATVAGAVGMFVAPVGGVAEAFMSLITSAMTATAAAAAVVSPAASRI
jgi:hypothetical protein